jgi:protein-tyrosine phosphatase
MSRFLPLGSTMNLRHMGGYKTLHGGTTRPDRLYRSGFLNISGDDQRRQFEQLAIRTIYDFRSPMERRLNNLQVGSDTEIIELGMLVASVENLWEMLLAEGLTPSGAEKIMGERYRELTEEEVPGYRTMFEHMAESEGGILVMCSFGKDRAGIASALLLTALGVEDTGVTADYLLSSNAYADKQAAIDKFEQFFNSEGLPVDDSIVLPILDARTAYLETAWQVMRQKSGSIEKFMIEELGIDAGARERLTGRFVSQDK